MSEEAITCCNCGIRFGVPSHWLLTRRQDLRSFFCPNGHSQSYTESTLDKVRRERDRLAQQIAQKNDEIARANRDWNEAEVRAAKAEQKVKRAQKRAHAGLCPCCNRTFSALAQHIATKHPGFRAEEVAQEKVVSLVKSRAA